MRKFIVSLSLILFSVLGYSQCSVVATPTVNPILCGQCVDVTAFGTTGTAVLNNDFDNGTLGPGWTSTPGAAMFTNPCDPSFDGGTYLWMGSATAGTRELRTQGFDLSCGGQVCFYLDFATQGGTGDCEGPDIAATEGVYFEYSINGGATWVTINYFAPNPGGTAGTITNWNQYCYNVPPAAMTINTMFHWEQPGNSGTCCDHWGIDNVEILANDCGYWYDWAHLAPAVDSSYGGQVCPAGPTTYTVMYTNGINDTCFASTTVNILFPTVTLTAQQNPIATCGGCTQLDATLSNIPPDSCCFTLDMQDSFGDGWNGGNLTVNVNGGPNLGPFSAAGNGSIVTFCILDGQTFTLDYVSGAWEGENTYTLYNNNMVALFNDGPNPAVGSVYNGLANCGGPPAVYTWTWQGNGLTPINDSTQTACPNTSGWYYVDVTGGGCTTTDSVYLTVNASSPPNVLTDTVCVGTNYTFTDLTQQVINVTTNHISTLVGASSNGCDSLVDMTVYTLVAVTSIENVSICTGTNYTFPDNTTQNNITTNTSYNSTLQTSAGCDSIVTTNITVLPDYNVSIDATICDGDNYTFIDGFVQNNITTPTSHLNSILSVDGCDSLVTENIFIEPTYNIGEIFSQCPGLSYTFPDGTTLNNINSNTTHVSNLQTSFGCDSIITTDVNIYPVPPMDITFTPNGCSPLIMSMTNNALGTNCSWMVNGPGYTNTYTGCGTITDTYINSGQYDVTMTMISVDGCPMDTTFNAFTVYPLPVANFDWTPIEGSSIENTIDFNNLTIGNNTYEWSFGDGNTSTETNPSHTYQDTGSYHVILMVENEWGCRDTVDGIVIINDVFLIYVPNSFSPDNDGNNETFFPVISGYDKDKFTMMIFDRWGELLYETGSTERGWNGTYKGKLVKNDSYVWKIVVTTHDNRKKTYTGTVTLLK